KLQTGRVKVDVKPPAGSRANCTVQSPVATASVRGTSVEFDTSNLKGNEGSVAFRGNRGLGLVIPAGMSSSVSIDGKAVDPLSSESATIQKPFRDQPLSPTPIEPTPDQGVDITITW
ncbi:MAG: hypothetical protein LBU82_07210, partial [Treponema sp.]|nr:hypothetical protein [Treponema sp.]